MKKRNQKVAPQDLPPGALPIRVLRILSITIFAFALVSLTVTDRTAIALSWVAGSVLLIAYSYHLQLMEREAYWLRIEQWERDQRLQDLIAQNAEIQQQLNAAISNSRPTESKRAVASKKRNAELERSLRRRYKEERDESTRRELMAEISKATANLR